jgi:transcriptional regulator with XRE-family HTH domain
MIGEWIRRIRTRHRFSQAVLAGRLAVDRTRVTRAEDGNSLNLSFPLRALLELDLESSRGAR